MFKVKVGSAPISWDAYPSHNKKNSGLSFEQMLDAMAAAGYEGTELESNALFPADSETMRAALDSRNLQVASSYVTLPLAQEGALDDMLETLDNVCTRFSRFNASDIRIACASSPRRLEVAGFVAADGSDGWNDQEWQRAAKALEAVAARSMERFNLRAGFHHHTGTFVETPAEVARLMEMTDPELVGLCLDTGHYHYGGGDVVQAAAEYADRIWYVHLKDVWPEKLERVRKERIHMSHAWEMDVFAELGLGCVDFPALFDLLRSNRYQGWLVVEQDSVGRSARDNAWSPFESAKLSRDYLRDVLRV
ncbi:MAG: TIM barrel protein [Caldilineaceae bacterium]|nr:TIM barrel protein [Caldilineaceae bacterium]